MNKNAFRFAVFAVAAMVAFLAPQRASARETNARFQLTFFGGVAFPKNAEKCSFVSQNPPELLDAEIYDNRVLELGGSSGTVSFSLCGTFRASDGATTVLAFLGEDGGTSVFLSSKRDVLALVPVENAGLVVIPYDYGDTRAGRSEEMADGSVPSVDLSLLRDILSWFADSQNARTFLPASATEANSAAGDPSLSGKLLFSGPYTQYGWLTREPSNPLLPEERFLPASPPQLRPVEIREDSVILGAGTSSQVALGFIGELPLAGRTFRLYAIESGAVHLAVSPAGDILWVLHIPNWKYETLFFDRGDTRKDRIAQISQSGGRCPAPSFPQFAEVVKWCFSQPVRAVNPPPGGGGGGGSGGGLGLCPNCRGRGMEMKPAHPGGTHGPWFCPDCGGSSYYYHYHVRCFQCGGTGRIRM